jgi:hypothetical protein
MSSMTQFLSTSRSRAHHGGEPVADVRIRRRSLATVAATVLVLAGLQLSPTAIANDRHDDSQ